MTHGHVFPPPLERDYPVVSGRIETRSLEAHVVDHCNLTCAQCCSLSPHLRPWFVEGERLARDLDLAARVLRPRVFKLVGGEPLLHPELVDLVRLVRRSRIAPTISLTTNGLLLERTPDELWVELDAMTISLYPRPALPETTIAATEARAERFGVTLNWKRQTQFVVMTRDERCEDASRVGEIFAECWLRERCHMIRDGRFYMCTRPPHFQSYLPGVDFSEDGIALHDGPGLLERLREYLLREQPLEACLHCHGGRAAMVPHRLLSRAELVRARR